MRLSLRSVSLLSKLRLRADCFFTRKSRATKNNRTVWLLPLLIPILGLLTTSSPVMPDSLMRQITISVSESAKIHNGDLIFRKAIGLGSQYIISVDTESDYSHVGIIHKVGDQITVIQSVPEQSLLSGGVREEPLEIFLKEIPLAAVYRLRKDPNGFADHAVQIAGTFIGTPFDARLDMSDFSAFYCTELVWFTYKQAGIDLLDGHYEKLNLPILGEGYYILPSSLVDSRWLYQVMIFKADQSSGG